MLNVVGCENAENHKQYLEQNWNQITRATYWTTDI